MLDKYKKSSGFTLIEIVLAIAIGSLILVIVFLAVGGAQRARRDAQRKSDAARYLAAAEQYASNNNGTYPTATIVATYLTNSGSTFNDPLTGVAYGITAGTNPGASPAAPTSGNMTAYSQAICASQNATSTGASLRNFAVTVFQENGASYCVDNH